MTKLTKAGLDDLSFNGATPVVISSGVIAFGTAAVANQGGFAAPCALKVVHAGVRILATTASTAADMQIGTATGTSNRILQPIDILGAGGAGYYDITFATLWGASGKLISAGEVVKFGAAAATAAGRFICTLVCMPQATVGATADDLG